MDHVATERHLIIYHDVLRLRSAEPTQFVDVTNRVGRCLRWSGVDHGVVQVRALHTTTAIVVNENEPLLLGDFRDLLERLAPGNGAYAHDDFARRGAPLDPDEHPNGSAHARALLLGDSRLFPVIDGRMELGRWQSIFLVELDGPRRRSISLTVMGYPRRAA